MTKHVWALGIVASLTTVAGSPPVPAQDPAGAVVPMTPERERRIGELAESARSNPDDGKILAEYGLALVRTGRMEDGLAALTRAIVLEPDEPVVHLAHAKGLWKGGYPAEAVSSAMKVVDSPLSRPKDVAEAYFVAGTIKSMQGDLATAQDYLRSSIESNPKNVGALLNLGLMLISTERRGEGLTYLEKARIHGPDNVRVHATYARIAEGLGHHKDALQAWERVAELRPDDPNVHLRIGGSHMGNQDFEKAAKSFERLVELEPEDGSYRVAYGEVLLRLQRYDEAMEQARRAHELGVQADSLVNAINFERRQFYDSSTAAGTGNRP